MPTFSHQYLQSVCRSLLVANRVKEEDAQLIAEHLVSANLSGHDSHGIIQLLVYIDRIEKGHILPDASLEILQETSTTARINGHWGFGYVITTQAMDLAIRKAKESNVGIISVFQQSHIGRLATYSITAAQEGMIGFITADSGRTVKNVVPFGGKESRLGTNPLCMAFPSNLPGPFCIDLATASVAKGKVDLAKQRGESIPLGWIIDKNGRPSTNPNDLDLGGSILPIGGDQGYKGYGLSVIVEVLSGILTGLGFGVDPEGIHNDGCFVMAINVEAFRSLKSFTKDITAFAEYLQETPLAPNSNKVYYPGELEYLTAIERKDKGIFVEEATWKSITSLMTRYGITTP